MIKLIYTGQAVCRVEGFKKFVPGGVELTFSEEDADTLLKTKLFKLAKSPKKTEPLGKKEVSK